MLSASEIQSRECLSYSITKTATVLSEMVFGAIGFDSLQSKREDGTSSLAVGIVSMVAVDLAPQAESSKKHKTNQLFISVAPAKSE